MLVTELRDLIYRHRRDNKRLTAISLSDASFKQLENDINCMLAYPSHGGNIMYIYGIAIIRKKEIWEESYD